MGLLDTPGLSKRQADAGYAPLPSVQTIGESWEQGLAANNTQAEVPLCEYALPADVATGDVYEMVVFGTVQHTLSTDANFVWRFRAGSVNALGTVTTAIPPSTFGRRYQLTVRLQIGAGGTGYMSGDLRLSDALSTTFNTTTIAVNGAALATGLTAGSRMAFTSQIFTAFGSTAHWGSYLRRVARSSGVSNIFNGAKPTRNGVAYNVGNPSREWSTKAISATTDRFELRSGDYLQTDGSSKERTEFGQASPVPFSTDIWWSYALYIEPGTTSTAAFCVLGQFQRTYDVGDVPTSPVIELTLEGTDLKFNTRSDWSDPSSAQLPVFTRWTLTNFARGQWHYFVHRMRFEKTSNGRLTSWHNGTQLFDGVIPVGGNDAAGPYMKYGIYRGASPETIAVQWANVEIGTTDLTARITSPLTIAS